MTDHDGTLDDAVLGNWPGSTRGDVFGLTEPQKGRAIQVLEAERSGPRSVGINTDPGLPGLLALSEGHLVVKVDEIAADRYQARLRIARDRWWDEIG